MSAALSRVAWAAGVPVRALLVGLIAAYRVTLGRLLAGRCRFHPTCSAYALEAIRVHGALKGSALSVWRVLRCSPLTAGGPDPVPAPRSGPSRQAV
ncbi:MAG TPA: membrane protein insertion efficiency factor YidD [Actinomycetota bacterium]|nr:membrane protein insertion efficiency factor YidD [Actinomycetota bacterium]